jgi:hypothetical protein
MEPARTQGLYRHISGARGHMANASKAPKLALKADRPTCHRFAANQGRVCLPAAASMRLETLRREVCRTSPWTCATLATLQLRLRKLGARVQACKERSTMSLPSSCPVASVWRRCVMWLGAVRRTPQAR